MSTELSHLIAGILIILIGIAALAGPVIKNYKETDPDVDHLKLRHMLISILTIVTGLLIASNRVDDVLNWLRGLGALLGPAA